MKAKIELDTMSDIKGFLEAINNVKEDVYLVDPISRFKVNAKSILGCLLSQAEWDDIWVECEADIYQLISKWIVL